MTGRRGEGTLPFHEAVQPLQILVKGRRDLSDLGALIVLADAHLVLPRLNLRQPPAQLLHRRENRPRRTQAHDDGGDQHDQQAIYQHQQHRVLLILPLGDVVSEIGRPPAPLADLHLIDTLGGADAVMGANRQARNRGREDGNFVIDVKLPAGEKVLRVIVIALQLPEQILELGRNHVAEDDCL